MWEQYNEYNEESPRKKETAPIIPPGHINPLKLWKVDRVINEKAMEKKGADMQKTSVKVREEHKDMHREFRMQNHENIELSQLILKQISMKKHFYPYIKLKATQQVLKIEAENEVEMKNHKKQEYINMDVMVMYRTGVSGYKVKEQIFDKYVFEQSSIQFEHKQFEFPQNSFFVFEGEKSRAGIINRITGECSTASDKAKFERQIKQYSFFDIAHIILGEDYLPKSCFLPPPEKSKLSPEFIEEWGVNNSRTLMEFITNEEDFAPIPPSYYIEDMNSYRIFMNQRAIISKKVGVNTEDREISSDIRNILSPEKIYFIQMMEESKSAVALAETAESRLRCLSIDIITEIHEILVNKSKEFLFLACTHLPSSIHIDERVKNLYAYFRSNFTYSDFLVQPSKETLKSSHVLDSWFNILRNDNIFGYSVKEIKEQLYKLVRMSCIMKKEIVHRHELQNIKAAIQKTSTTTPLKNAGHSEVSKTSATKTERR